MPKFTVYDCFGIFFKSSALVFFGFATGYQFYFIQFPGSLELRCFFDLSVVGGIILLISLLAIKFLTGHVLYIPFSSFTLIYGILNLTVGCNIIFHVHERSLYKIYGDEIYDLGYLVFFGGLLILIDALMVIIGIIIPVRIRHYRIQKLRNLQEKERQKVINPKEDRSKTSKQNHPSIASTKTLIYVPKKTYPDTIKPSDSTLSSRIPTREILDTLKAHENLLQPIKSPRKQSLTQKIVAKIKNSLRYDKMSNSPKKITPKSSKKLTDSQRASQLDMKDEVNSIIDSAMDLTFTIGQTYQKEFYPDLDQNEPTTSKLPPDKVPENPEKSEKSEKSTEDSSKSKTENIDSQNKMDENQDNKDLNT